MPDNTKELARRLVAVFDSGDTTILDEDRGRRRRRPQPTARHWHRPARHRRLRGDLPARVPQSPRPPWNAWSPRATTSSPPAPRPAQTPGEVWGAPPTGKTATFAYMDIYRITDGRIVECWQLEEVAGMLGQLGLLLQ